MGGKLRSKRGAENFRAAFLYYLIFFLLPGRLLFSRDGDHIPALPY
jgi:hypothetical protein